MHLQGGFVTFNTGAEDSRSAFARLQSVSKWHTVDALYRLHALFTISCRYRGQVKPVTLTLKTHTHTHILAEVHSVAICKMRDHRVHLPNRWQTLSAYIRKTTYRASHATITVNTRVDGFIALQILYLLVFIHLEDTISFSPSRYVKSLLPSPLSVPSPFDGRNERHYPRKFRSLADKMSIMSGRNLAHSKRAARSTIPRGIRIIHYPL